MPRGSNRGRIVVAAIALGVVALVWMFPARRPDVAPSRPAPAGEAAAPASPMPAPSASPLFTPVAPAPTATPAERRTGSIAGRVVDIEGQPIASAHVEVRESAGEHPARLGSADTSTSGTFLLTGLPLGRTFNLTAAKPFHIQTSFIPIILSPEAPNSETEVVLEAAGGIRGLVTDAQGRPVAGARVQTGLLAGHYSLTNLTPRAETGPEGRYELTRVPGGANYAMATADGYAGRRLPQVEVEEGKFTDGVDFSLGSGLTLSGRVVSRIGKHEFPEAGVAVHAYPRMLSEPAGPAAWTDALATTTTQDGRFVLTGAAAPLEYEFRAEKGLRATHGDDKVTLTTGSQPPEVTLVLPGAGPVRVRVVDARGEPVAGASVGLLALTNLDAFHVRNVFWANSQPQGMPAPTTTNASGEARIDGLPTDALFELMIDAGERGRVGSEPFAPDPEAVHTITLPTLGSIHGQVTLAGTNVPALDMTIAAQASDPRGDLMHFTAPTDSGGAYEFRDLPPGTYAVGARSEAGAGTSLVARPVGEIVVRPAESRRVDLEALAAATVSGAVTCDGQPVAGATVSFQMANGPSIGMRTADAGALGTAVSAVTGADGHYTANGVFPGRVLASAAKPGLIRGFESTYSPLQNKGREMGLQEVQLEPGDTRAGVDFRLYRASDDPDEKVVELRGVAVDPEGRPVAGITVWTYYASGMIDMSPHYSLGRSAVTDANGRFAFHEKAKRMEGVVVLPTLAVPWQGSAGRSDGEIELRLSPASSVNGIVALTDGTPVEGAEVRLNTWGEAPRLYGQIGPDHAPTTIRTGPDGLFSFAAVPAGQGRIEVSKEGLRTATVESFGQKEIQIEAGKPVNDIVLLMEPEDERTFTGRLVDANGRPLAGWRVWTVPPSMDARTTEDGSFQYKLSSLHRQVHLTEREDHVSANGSALVREVRYETGPIDYPAVAPPEGQVFMAPAVGTISGRLIDAQSGEPAANAEVQLNAYASGPGAGARFSDLTVNMFLARPYGGANPDGTFRFEQVPVGTYRLTPHPNSSLPDDSVKDIVVGPGAQIDLGDVPVRPTPTPAPTPENQFEIDGRAYIRE